MSPLIRLFVIACLGVVSVAALPDSAVAHSDHGQSATAAPATPHAEADDHAGWRLGLLGIYCVLIVGASLLGGWLPSLINLTHTRMQLMISFVGGLMLGIGVFHLLPHSVHELKSVDECVRWMMFGIVAMFLLIRMFHVHHHGPLELPDESGTLVEDSYQRTLQPAPPAHDHDHDHDDAGAGHHHAHDQAHRLSWLGITLGLALHTLIDGIALGASVQADAGHEPVLLLFGFGTFLAVVLHKPLDAVSITSLMAAGGWPARSRTLVNIGFALMCPLGALLFVLGVEQFAGSQQAVVGASLAFAAGVFLCIALSDLLPEMEFHSHSRLPLTLALLLGIILAWSITFLEPAHLH